MFKVEEGEDGVTNIYVKDTGRLLCIVPPTKNSRVPRKVNVVKPQQVVLPASTTKLNFSPHYKVSSNIYDDVSSSSSTDDEAFDTKKKISLEPEIIEDFSDDCISEEQFARCLNLVSSDKFASEPRQKLLHDHPLRHLSKSQAFRYNEKSKDEPSMFESVPITSLMGMNKLKQSHAKIFLKQPAIDASFKKYEAYCRQPFNAQPNGYQFPKLRCREKKVYPICTSAKVNKQEYHHCFTYGRRQRLERIRDLDTGLSRRTRRLIRICNRKTIKIQLERLSPATIKDWTTIKPRSPSTSNSKIIISFPLHKLPYVLQCRVRLPNILKSIEKRPSGYYVRNTSTRVRDFPLTRPSRSRTLVPSTQSPRTPSTRSPRTPSTSTVLVHRTPFSSSSSVMISPFSKVGAPLKVKFPSELKAIPIIDLTQESSPIEGFEPETVVDNWLFKCFACGLVRYYYNPSYKDDLRKHMSHFHSIPDPEKFLYRYMDRVNKRTVIEAFPGCKTQDIKPAIMGGF